jgi:hypothetical protein
MRRRHLLFAVGGLVLGSFLPTEAQTLATQISLLQPSSRGTARPFRESLARLLPVVPRNQLPDKPVPRNNNQISDHAYLLASAYKPQPRRESWLEMEEFRSPLLTESSFDVAHLWRGLQLDAFESTLHSQSLQLGSPMSNIGFEALQPTRSDQATIANSIGRDGIRLRYTFGHDYESQKPAQILRCASLIVGKVHGCPL